MNELFLKIINMSISASWLVLAVLLLRFVLKKAPKWVNVLLWGIVAVRLAFPFSIESALSLIPSAETIPPNIGMNTTPTINSGINAINNAVNPIISQSNTPMAGASVNPLQITIGIFEYIWIFGMIDNRVIIYDYANGVSYELSDRGYFDFTLRQDHQDGRLYVDKTKYHTDELVETGRLVFKNHCIQIEGFSNEAHQVFQAEILEIHDGNYLVKPVEGSWELSSADRIEVPIRNVHPSPEPEIGDVIEIEYAGEILETYPAQIADVYGIKVIEKNKGFTHLANDD